jgi:hypothetical protein
MWFKKKKKEAGPGMPQVPVFSGAPVDYPAIQPPPRIQEHNSTYEQPPAQQFAPIQEHVPLPRIEMPEVEHHAEDIPQRQPAFLQKKTYPQREASGKVPQMIQEHQPVPIVEHLQPQVAPLQPQPIQQPTPEQQPVFVKLEHYREALANIELLKQKIKETEIFIDKIEEMRSQEQVELNNCRENITKLKEKLLAVDKRLFEA